MSEKVFLVDTDPGVDDCAALMMLMSQAPKVKIVGLTCAAGNVGFRDVMINAVRIVKLFDKVNEIPVFGGCSEPILLVPKFVDAAFYHGKDGLGDVPDVYPERDERLLEHVQTEHGVDAIIRLSKEYEGRLQLICLGALTNIAMAAKLDPDLPKRIKSIHILGGTIRGIGNETPCAEYNFAADPEAAYNVFRTFPQHCTTEVVPYEITLDYAVLPGKFDQMTSGDGQRRRFYREVFNICRPYEDRNIARGFAKGYAICDAYVAAAVVDPAVVNKSISARVGIELGGSICRGSFVIDHKNKGSPHLSQADVRVITGFDEAIFERLLAKAFEE